MAIKDGKGDLIYSSRDFKRRFPKQGFYNHIKIDTSGVVLANKRDYFSLLDIDGHTLNDSSIPDSKIIDVDFAKIKNVLIDTAHIKDAAITTAKIDDLAVTEAKIDNLAVTEAKIDDLAVTDAKIANLSASKINAGYIVTTQLDTGTNPNTGCILDGSGLRAYQSGTKMVDIPISGNPYFRGEGHFGDDSNYVRVGEQANYQAVLFYTSGSFQGMVRGYSGGRIDVRGLTVNISYGDISSSSVRLSAQNDKVVVFRKFYNTNMDDLGTGDNPWNNIYFCKTNDVCSLGIVEEISNPIELLKNIKVSKDKYTPKEIPKADYKTLPKFIKTVKYSDFKKSEENFKEHLQSILSRNAEITYEDDEKVTVKIEALDITATISLLLGAIRQLNKKIEALEKGKA